MEKEYPKPSVTVDIIVFSVQNNDLKVLLIKRAIDPFKDNWAIPGGFIKLEESLENAAKRELKEETGIDYAYLEQLYTFGDVNRDPRGRVITVAYYALLDKESAKQIIKADTDVSDVAWFSVAKLPTLAFDHSKILEYALKRLKWKFEYTTVGFSMLPKKFTLTDIQETYETIFNKKFDKRNFRKKILSLGILKPEGKMKQVSNRPPEMYSLKKKIGEVVGILPSQ